MDDDRGNASRYLCPTLSDSIFTLGNDDGDQNSSRTRHPRVMLQFRSIEQSMAPFNQDFIKWHIFLSLLYFSAKKMGKFQVLTIFVELKKKSWIDWRRWYSLRWQCPDRYGRPLRWESGYILTHKPYYIHGGFWQCQKLRGLYNATATVTLFRRKIFSTRHKIKMNNIYYILGWTVHSSGMNSSGCYLLY